MQKINTKQTNQSILMTRVQAAQRYACSLRLIDELLAEGFLPSVKLSKRCRRIPVEEADEAMLGSTVKR